jgi:hypothetical protein
MMMGYLDESKSCYKVGPFNFWILFKSYTKLPVADLGPYYQKALDQ